ncbi:MAG: hypothetical protein ABR576_07635 [Thermoanaerobaculia bacterium]
MSRKTVWAGVPFLLYLASGVSSATGYGRYDVSVVVDGERVPEHRLGDKTYIEAIRGRSFSLRISNPGPERIAVAVSVDGRNVIDAKRTTALGATKWVLGPGELIDVPGWQISGDTARRFFFTETRSSYAKWLGDTRNVGTIEAVFFREKRRWPVGVVPAPAQDTVGAKEREGGTPSGETQAGASDDLAGALPPGEAKDEVRVQSEGRARRDAARQKNRPESDRFAATGAGERTHFPVNWIEFDEDPDPVAQIRLRYEFRPELIRLGVLRPREDLHARERGRGFERQYAPDPHR